MVCINTECNMHTIMDMALASQYIFLWPLVFLQSGKMIVKRLLCVMALSSLTPKPVLGIPPGEHMVTLIRVTDDDVCPPAGSGMDSCVYDFPSVHMIFGGHFFSCVGHFQTIMLYGLIQGRSCNDFLMQVFLKRLLKKHFSLFDYGGSVYRQVQHVHPVQR